MSRRSEIQVGVTVVVALAVLLWGVTWLREFTLGRRVHVWHVRFPQTGGLGASDEVQVNGIRKGSVARIDLVGDHVVVDLALATDVRLTSDCRVAIRNVGLMGEKVIMVYMADTGRPIAERDTIDGVYELGTTEVIASLGASMEAMDRVVRSIDALARRLDRNGAVDATLTNLKAASEQLAASVRENRALLHETLVNANAASKTAKELTTDREAQYKRTLDSVERASHNMEVLSARLDSLRADAQSVVGRADHGDGTLAKLLNDRGLYDDVRSLSKALKELVEDIRKNPKKYVNIHVL